jgi:hypothetical protein
MTLPITIPLTKAMLEPEESKLLLETCNSHNGICSSKSNSERNEPTDRLLPVLVKVLKKENSKDVWKKWEIVFDLSH